MKDTMVVVGGDDICLSNCSSYRIVDDKLGISTLG